MDDTRISINLEPNHNVPTVSGWVTLQAKLAGTIPAPIDPECVTAPDQLEPGDAIMVHAMGSWYPGTVLRQMPKSGKLEVEYKSGAGVTRRKAVARAELVPGGCGYPTRQDNQLAAAWAGAVWAALAKYREAVSAGIAALNADIVKGLDDGTTPTIGADDLVTVQAAEAGAPGEPIPPPVGLPGFAPGDRVAEGEAIAAGNAAYWKREAAEAPRKVRRRVTISVRLPVTLELLVESDDEVGGEDGVAIEDTTFSVIDVVRVIPPDVSVSEANEEIGNDPDNSEELDRAARGAEGEE